MARKYQGMGGNVLEFMLCPGSSTIFFKISDKNVESSVSIAYVDAREIKDDLVEHLGEAQGPLPVGTIVVGEGLTEAQKTRLDEADKWEALRESLHGISWLRTQEGSIFWRALSDRCSNVIACMIAEKKRRELPVRSDVGNTSVLAIGDAVSVTHSGYPSSPFITPDQARELATALVKHAEAAEKGGRK